MEYKYSSGVFVYLSICLVVPSCNSFSWFLLVVPSCNSFLWFLLVVPFWMMVVRTMEAEGSILASWHTDHSCAEAGQGTILHHHVRARGFVFDEVWPTSLTI